MRVIKENEHEKLKRMQDKERERIRDQKILEDYNKMMDD